MNSSTNVRLRPYQVLAIERVRAAIRAGSKKTLLVLPTGGGKTVVAAAIIGSAYGRGKRVVFFAHRRELIKQTRAKLIDAGIPAEAIGIMLGAESHGLDAPIIVASIQTWARRNPPLADLVFIDEAHRSCSNSYRTAIEHYASQGAVVLGLTATPFRSDGRGLGDVYDALETIAYPSQLVADGFLVEPKAFSVASDLPDLSKVRTVAGDYRTDELAAAMDTPMLVGGIVEQWLKHAGNRQTVVFACDVQHSIHIAESFISSGIPAEHIDGETPKAARDAILARLASGETRVVSNCAVLTEGWDCPVVKCASLARPTKSVSLYLQMAGRILRPYGEETAVLIDHGGSCIAHGLPQDDREFSLTASRPKGKPGEAPHKCCKSCDAIVPTSCAVCPECGVAFPEREGPLQVDADLVEVKPRRKLTEREELIIAFESEVERWQRENLKRVSRGVRPVSRSAVYSRFRTKFKRRPPNGCVAPPDHHATESEKREKLHQLSEVATTRNIPFSWVLNKFIESFGHGPEGLL